jgi:hypothetical protein
MIIIQNSQSAVALAKRLDCGGFSTAFRPRGNHPCLNVFRPHQIAAEAGAVQTLRDYAR